LDSSATWVENFPNQSLAFVLSDAGYDVYLGNVRGNTYGLRHVKLNKSQVEFWNFSWDEISNYDLVSMINYALKTSNQESLFYVGHSQGTLISFAQLSKNRELTSKIRLFLALGPVATTAYIQSPIKLLGNLKFLGLNLRIKLFWHFFPLLDQPI
jgi:predicted alpha/beta hydrolase